MICKFIDIPDLCCCSQCESITPGEENQELKQLLDVYAPLLEKLSKS